MAVNDAHWSKEQGTDQTSLYYSSASLLVIQTKDARSRGLFTVFPSSPIHTCGYFSRSEKIKTCLISSFSAENSHTQSQWHLCASLQLYSHLPEKMQFLAPARETPASVNTPSGITTSACFGKRSHTHFSFNQHFWFSFSESSPIWNNTTHPFLVFWLAACLQLNILCFHVFFFSFSFSCNFTGSLSVSVSLCRSHTLLWQDCTRNDSRSWNPFTHRTR